MFHYMIFPLNRGFQIVALLCGGWLVDGSWAADEKPEEKPELPEPPRGIVYFYADDLGYGDVGCYGAKLIPTPNVDRLAEQGLRFTNAHSTTSVCTPSRYAVMTGEYPWRRKGVHILPGDAPLVVPTAKERMSLPAMLKQAGYKTCAIGKWHLGLGNGKIDWNGEIRPGPREVGFDESFIMAATADRVPCVYIRNGRVDQLDPADPLEVSYGKAFPDEPTGRDNPELLRVLPLNDQHRDTVWNGISRIGFMRGGKAALWKDCDMADVMTREAVNFIERAKDEPFFLYFATNDIHTPRDPHQRFLGKSGCGIRGDATVQMDDCLGRIIEVLKKTNRLDSTLIIFSSDNGPVVIDGYADGSDKALNGHKPAGPWKGGKYTLDEGGTRVPFIVWWPGKVKPGTSEALVCQMDLAASLAALTRQQYPAQAFPDSQNVLPALLGLSQKGRDYLVEQATSNQQLALVSTTHKYIPAQSLRPKIRQRHPQGMLYDLKKDPGETHNVASEQPLVAEQMRKQLQEIRQKP